MDAVDDSALRALIDGIRSGEVTADEAVARLSRLPFADLGDTLVDHHRTLRQGMPEAVYGPGKTPEQCVRIVAELLEHGSGPVLLTRADEAQVKAATAIFGPGIQSGGCVLWREPSEIACPTRADRHAPAPPTRRSPTRRRSPCAPTASTPIGCTTSASPVSTGCSPTSIASPAPMP